MLLFFRRSVVLRGTILLIGLIASTEAWQTIAHRGVFHDQSEAFCVPENSVAAISRAFITAGVAGVEIDVRVSRDGVLMAFHDDISNVKTTIDNDRGYMNAIQVALKHQPPPPPLKIADRSGAYWEGAILKAYGPDGRLTKPLRPFRMVTLYTMLRELKGLHGSRRIIFLDIQSWYAADQAAAIIRELGMQDTVHLKFFASKAISPGAYKYNGADTCYRYALLHKLSGIKIIPVVNDGELIIKGGKAYIHAFQTDLDVEVYLSCWLSAEKDHAGNGAALLAMVEGTPPANTKNPIAQAAITRVMQWARRNKRPTNSAVGMPDACTLISGNPFYWLLRGDAVSAITYSHETYLLRKSFADKWSDYVTIDVMGDFENRLQTSDWKGYTNFLC